MRPRDAFEICHEIYVGARELVDKRLPTTQLESTSKYLWRPDLRPRLVEYVADFALAGERALAPAQKHLRGNSAAGGRQPNSELRASRLILFRMHYLGGAEYQAARRLLGISEITWADWTDEIRERVGRELLRSRIFPPSRYFKVLSSPRGRAMRDSSRRDAPRNDGAAQRVASFRAREGEESLRGV